MNCTSPNVIYPHRSVDWLDKNEEKPMSVPCGKCLPCLSNKRVEWSFRLEQEFRYSKGAHFVTLTYDRKHYPGDGNLNKRDVQLYLKRLRKRDGTNKIRYYAVGEYGSKSGRAHYHLLIFNAQEEHIRKSWCDSLGKPIGIVHVGTVTAASVAYVTKYIVQPFEVPPGRIRPFAMMSRRYGIGGKYLTDEMVRWHRSGNKNYVIKDGVKQRLPKFYRDKIWPVPSDRKPLTSVASAIRQRLQAERETVTTKALELSIQNAIKEEKYWRREHGDQWQKQRDIARLRVIQRIRKKVSFTQQF